MGFVLRRGVGLLTMDRIEYREIVTNKSFDGGLPAGPHHGTFCDRHVQLNAEQLIVRLFFDRSCGSKSVITPGG
jgi:hypothetical protein